MNGDANDAGRAVAQAAGLERYFRRAALDMVNRIVVALIVVGGLAVGLAAGSHSRHAVQAAVLVSLGVALLWAALVVMRYAGIRRRLRQDPATEVARLRARPGRHQRRYFAGADLGRSARAGAFSEDANPSAGDSYAQMRNLEGLGPDASPDGVNRTGDPREGPIE
ncbi:MAG: hypothetical protein KGJ36_07320 [Acidobacteriota bacterium]|nr:hypothetical protein [Acidobacteriota bacterium]